MIIDNYRSTFNDKSLHLWNVLSEDLNPLTLVTLKKSQDMDHELIQQMGTDKMILRYVYHKPFMVKFPNKCDCQNRFNPDH